MSTSDYAILATLALPLLFLGVCLVGVITAPSPAEKWEVRAFCECGWWTRAPFGSLFHVHVECCPSCGADKHDMRLKTSRWDKGASAWEFKP